MLKRSHKLLFYALMSPFMRLNGWRHKLQDKNRHDNKLVHLGPGQRNYLDGWINVDANMFTGRCDIWTDLRFALPFTDNSVDAFYSHHVIEHLPDLKFHINDVYRCLKRNGVYRVGGPNGDVAIHKFLNEDYQWFDNFPEEWKSIGGKLDNFIFCKQEHLHILTYSFVEELMSEAGFKKIRQVLPVRETGFDHIFKSCLNLENETDFENPHTLIIEAQK